MERPKLQCPSFWYLIVAILLGATAYPSVTWLPGFVEKYRWGGTGLLMAQFLFARNLGQILAFLTAAALSGFILSAFYAELKSTLALKLISVIVIGVYALFSLMLLMCLAAA